MKNMTDGMTAAAIENNRDIEIYLEFFIQNSNDGLIFVTYDHYHTFYEITR